MAAVGDKDFLNFLYPSITPADPNIVAYIGGSSIAEHTDEARVGGGLWYSHDNLRNAALPLPTGPDQFSPAAGELAVAMRLS
jgi:hypothetical protein